MCDQSRMLRFKTFQIVEQSKLLPRTLQNVVDKYFDDYKNVEIISTTQSQNGAEINLSVFFKADYVNSSD